MGHGLALKFHQRFPQQYFGYVDLCEGGLVRPGHLVLS